MEEFIKICKEHNYDVIFNITDKMYQIEMIITPNNFHTTKDLVMELDSIYLGELNFIMDYEQNKGIRLVITPNQKVNKEQLLLNIINILNDLYEITYPELDYELIYRIMYYLKKMNVTKITVKEIDESFSLSVIHHKNILLPEALSKNNIVIKKTKGNYEKETFHLLEFEDLIRIVEELYYPKPEKKEKNILKRILKWK